jgi:hypothetical protein
MAVDGRRLIHGAVLNSGTALMVQVQPKKAKNCDGRSPPISAPVHDKKYSSKSTYEVGRANRVQPSDSPRIL